MYLDLLALLYHLAIRITRGRPMEHIGYLFTDMVINKPVYLMKDRLGRYWMASTPWSWFRVKTEPSKEEAIKIRDSLMSRSNNRG